MAIEDATSQRDSREVLRSLLLKTEQVKGACEIEVQDEHPAFPVMNGSLIEIGLGLARVSFNVPFLILKQALRKNVIIRYYPPGQVRGFNVHSAEMRGVVASVSEQVVTIFHARDKDYDLERLKKYHPCIKVIHDEYTRVLDAAKSSDM